MNKYTDKKIIEFLNTLFDCNINIKVNDKDLVELELKQMYEYPDLQFKHLKQISDFFDTDNIKEERYYSPGCQSCDYGSSYIIELTIR